MLSELFAIVAPVFVCAGIGFTWAKRGRNFDTAFVTDITTLLGVPCLVFTTLVNLPVSPASFMRMATASAVAIIFFALAGTLILRITRQPLNAFLPSMIFSNCGNMGLPLCLFAFGQPGLALGIGYFTVSAVAQFTIGAWISSGQWSPLRLLQTPLLYAVAVGLTLMLLGISPPKWITNTTGLIGNLTIPLMLITLGVSLARLRVAGLGRSGAMALVRLSMGLGGGFAVAWALGLGGAERGVLLIESAMPVAVFNYLFAQRYGREPAEVAGMVLISTAVSFATLPWLLFLVL